MAESFNPYAPPAAEVDQVQQIGTVARDAHLIRLDRNGQLPDRCVACNAPALPFRVARTLYWSRWEWRLFIWVLPAILLLTGMMGVAAAGILFAPSVVILLIANAIVRQRIGIEIGLCRRHLRMRRGLAMLIWICCAAAVVLPFVSMSIGSQRIGNIVAVLLPLMLGLGLAYAFSAANRLAVKRLTQRHVWLKGAGASFRNSLPEAAPD